MSSILRSMILLVVGKFTTDQSFSFTRTDLMMKITKVVLALAGLVFALSTPASAQYASSQSTAVYSTSQSFAAPQAFAALLRCMLLLRLCMQTVAVTVVVIPRQPSRLFLFTRPPGS